MVRLPWRRGADGNDSSDSASGESGDSGASDPASEYPGGIDVEPLVDCEFQDGNLFVYEDHVHIERDDRSRFTSKSIPMDRIRGVEYAKGITIGYLQIEQVGVESDEAGLLSDPIDENTLHFQRNRRSCATEARDAIRARRSG